MSQRLLTPWAGNVWVHLGITLIVALLSSLLVVMLRTPFRTVMRQWLQGSTNDFE